MNSSFLDLRFSVRFFPVGQGLFSAGRLSIQRLPRPVFVWVYDCGSISDRRIKEAINTFDTKLKCTPERLDLLVISHFDNDHISGITELLTGRKVGALLLPFISLGTRLAIAFAQGVRPADDILRFYINPVAYLTSLPDVSIDRIYIVGTADEAEGPLSPQGLPPDDLPELELAPLRDSPRADLSEDESSWATGARARTGNAQTQVQFLGPRPVLHVSNMWEFVPYNEPPRHPIDAEFLREVQAHAQDVLSEKDAAKREQALNRLRDVYDHRHSEARKERNQVSLFLYSGPISALRGRIAPSSLPSKWLRGWCPYVVDRCSSRGEKLSQLYTGDGFLDDGSRLGSLVRYLQEARMRKIAVLQVMHHGSRHNWHDGVAFQISPLFSVFCSDPSHATFHHPHAPVLADFWDYGPVQVDQEAFQVDGCVKLNVSRSLEPEGEHTTERVLRD